MRRYTGGLEAPRWRNGSGMNRSCVVAVRGVALLGSAPLCLWPCFLILEAVQRVETSQMTMVCVDLYGMVRVLESTRPRDERASMTWTSRPVKFAGAARYG
jgi:hypothetical protein